MNKLLFAAIEGFVGSFRLAAAIVLAVMAVAAAFVHGGPDAAAEAARHANRF